MKKYQVIVILISGILITIFIIEMILGEKYNNINNIKSNEIDTYFKECYDKSIKIKDISLIDGCYATCTLVNNPCFEFSVVYWANEDKYIDSYLQKCLEWEAKQLIHNKLQEKFDYECYIQLLTGSFIEKYSILYDFYKYLGRPLSWQDDICKEKLSYIHLVIYNDNLSKDDAYSVVELINTLPVAYNRIIISKNASENIILELP